MGNSFPVTVGAVGTGRIYNHAHLPVYPVLFKKARLVGFYDLSAERAELTRSHHEEALTTLAGSRPELTPEIDANIAALKVHDSLDSLLDSVDAVDIATHARGRMPSAIAAFNAGVSVMAEKPMGRVWTETDRAVRALAAVNARTDHSGPNRADGDSRFGRPVIFQLNDDNAFDPKYLMIRDIIQRGEIGKVQHITLIRGCQYEDDNLLPAEVTGLENGGGAMMAYGSHGLAGALSLSWPNAAPVAVEAVSVATRRPERMVKGELSHLQVDDNAQIKVLVEDTTSGSWSTVFFEATLVGGHIGLSETHGGGQSSGLLRIIGDKGMIDTESSENMTIKYWTGGVEEIPLREYAGESISFQTEMNAFFEAFSVGTKPVFDGEFGSAVIAVCGSSYLSAKEGGTVSLDQFKDYCRGFTERLGDTSEADDAIITDLLEPYAR